MGQKIHPLAFRLGITQKHKSIWFYENKEYSNILEEDHKIRYFIENKFKLNGISKIYIFRKANQIEIQIESSKPGLIVGRSGNNLESLRKEIYKILAPTEKIRISVIEVMQPDADASLVSEFIVQQLEKRIAFRRIMRQAVNKAQRTSIKGIKIQIAGRLNGAEIARTEWLREGKVPLQTLRANIDYAYKKAQTSYGILGVKVWIFKNEIL
jgi:small subunit ribosomal protein S3